VFAYFPVFSSPTATFEVVENTGTIEFPKGRFRRFNSLATVSRVWFGLLTVVGILPMAPS